MKKKRVSYYTPSSYTPSYTPLFKSRKNKKKNRFVLKNLFLDSKKVYSNNKSLFVNDLNLLETYLDESGTLYIAVKNKFGIGSIVICFADVDLKDFFKTLLKSYPKEIRQKFRVLDQHSFLLKPIKGTKLVIFIGDAPKNFVEVCLRQNTLVLNIYYINPTAYNAYNTPILVDNFKKIVWLLLFYINSPRHEAQRRRKKIQAQKNYKVI